jgi:ParB family chromosome partitioning protein
VPNPRQPRTHFDPAALDELAQSIRRSGVVQPVVVRPTACDRYELVAGERRWRAARIAGLERIGAVVRRLSDAEAVELALIENIQREDLSPLERAAAYQRYIEVFGVSAEELATRLGVSRPSVINYLRLTRLPAEVRELIASGDLAMGQARAIAGIESVQDQIRIARLAVRRNLSARQVEDLARGAVNGDLTADASASAALRTGRQKHFDEIERAMSRAVGARVRLYSGRSKNSGRIVISYSSLEEFERIAERLGCELVSGA